jgi:hypothetical protein
MIHYLMYYQILIAKDLEAGGAAGFSHSHTMQ